MKLKTLAVLLGLMLASPSYAQVVREGMTFKTAKTAKAKADTIVTAYSFEDSKGNKYPIVVNKSTGRCYIWKKSGKTGRMYKQYMKPEISQAIYKELGIAYKPKK